MSVSKMCAIIGLCGSIGCLVFGCMNICTHSYSKAVFNFAIGIGCGIVNYNIIKEESR